METLTRYLEALAQPDVLLRRAALEQALGQENLAYATQTCEATEKQPHPPLNYLLLPAGQENYPLFCAHYDAYPGSPGANDNAAACCILLSLAVCLRDKGVRAGFAFFDGEEQGHSGAKLFQNERGELPLSAVINLDMCGYGDTLAVYCKGGKGKPAARNFCDKKLLEAHGGRMVDFLPESDDRAFRTHDQPVISVAIMPKWDAKYMDALATYNEGLLGKPPEFEMIMGQLEVVTTMHGGFRDGVKWVELAAMQQVYDYLLHAATAPQQPAKRFGLFG